MGMIRTIKRWWGEKRELRHKLQGAGYKLQESNAERARLIGVVGRLEKQLEAMRPPVAVEYLDAEPEWTVEHAQAWNHFLTTTEAGLALRRLANWSEQGANRQVLGASTADAVRAVGEARGWHKATVYFFHSLSAKGRPQQSPDEQASDADALRERLAS